MIEQIPVSGEGIYAFRLRGRLTHADYQSFIPLLEGLIRRHGRLSLLLELVDFQGWDLDAALDDFRLGTRHEDDFERIAVVGDKAWEKWMVRLAAPFSRAEIRYFDRDELQAAWDWLEAEPQETPEPPVPVPGTWRHILVATDFSPSSEQAAVQARRLAEQDGARLSLIHVIEEPLLYDDPGGTMPSLVDLERTLEEGARLRLQRFRKRLGLDDLAAVELVFGAPAVTVAENAERLDCDLIVVGARGRRGLSRLLGSTAAGIQRHAGCDVLVVRPRLEGGTG